MSFILGCNYWASHAGTEMWTKWDEAVIEKDLKSLSENGIRYLRVFPLWRDFQPVKPLYGSRMRLCGYCMENENPPQNLYYIDEEMMTRFHRFCELAETYGLKLIVGIVTGWMSGRLFVPNALNNLDLYTDPEARMLTVKYVHGFVHGMRNESAVFAWDLGNECNCMAEISSREVAYTWTAMVADAIRAEDPSRPVISGMHTLRIDNAWTIADQGELTDILTTHPYPQWVAYARVERTLSVRTLLHSAAETELYRSLGKKPTFVEEIGTMGPQICDDENAAIFLRCQLFSNWANDNMGLLWWCAFDQDHLDYVPYSSESVERYLGLFTKDYCPKPVLHEFRRFSEFMSKLSWKLPSKKIDAICLLTKDTDQWGIAYMTYVLAKQAGLTIGFANADVEIPDVNCYLLPSVRGVKGIEKSRYEELKRKVREGATLYISRANGILSEFEEVTGAHIADSDASVEAGTVCLDGCEESFTYLAHLLLQPTSAEILLRDGAGSPLFLRNSFGKGQVFYLNFPLEENLLERSGGFEGNLHRIYRYFANGIRAEKPVITEDPMIGITYHNGADGSYIVLINYSAQTRETALQWNISVRYRTLYGNAERLEAGEACILAFGQPNRR